jgi:DNA-binding SARP family transcriptional activator/Tfp pilus assembly protein PilF
MIRFRLLGPLEVRAGEDWRSIGAPKWRSLLAALLISAGQVVSTDALIDEIWGEDPPAKAANLVSIYVLRLRRLIADGDDSGLLVTRAPGYQLRTEAGHAITDVQQFEAMVRDGRRALAGGNPEQAAGHLAEALGLWRGSVLADVPRTPLVEGEAERLAELKMDAAELRVTAELQCGGHSQVVTELRRLLADHPLREGLWLLLMQALDGSGRHAEALDAYGQARNAIADELGVDPGPELRRAHAKLLAEDGRESGPDNGPAGIIAGGTVQAPVTPGTSGGQPARHPQAPPSQASQPERRQAPRPQRPAQLPADVADFTGREDQVKHLCDLLSATPEVSDNTGAVRIALVAGSGGLGKTSLAVHAAHQVRTQFPDGQLYVDLLGATAHPLQPADVLARFLRDLGVDGRDVPLDEAERAARYRTTLDGRRVLVVLDNAKDAAQVRSLLPGSASCAVLVTTRNRMPDLASTRLVDLNVLDDDDALTLFTRVVGDERVTAEPEATAELLLACAGLPLAIRICAARLVTRSGWTIRAMANRLRDEHRRLDEMTVGDLAVRASFEVSFASLPAPRRGIDPALAFRLLGLWHGPTISSAAAAALFDATEDDAVDALEMLVDAHLLESKSPYRYKFHDLLRVYSSERAVSDVTAQLREAAVERLLGWYMYTVDAAAQAISSVRYTMPLDEAGPSALGFPGSDEALAWYDDERVNLTAATRQASASGLHDIAWRLPAPLFTMTTRRANWAELIATHQVALDSARQTGNRQGEAWLLNNLGDALGRKGDPAGIGHLEQALEIAREIGDRIGEVRACNNLGDVLEALGREDEALEQLQRALDLCRKGGNRYQEGAALTNMGSVLIKLNRTGEAIDCLEQASRTLVDAGQSAFAGYALNNLGRCYLSENRFADALDSLSRALDSHRAAGNRHQQAVSLRLLGTAQARAGMTQEARETLTRATSIFEELGDVVTADQVRAEHGDISLNVQCANGLRAGRAGRYDAARLPRTKRSWHRGPGRPERMNHGERSCR